MKRLLPKSVNNPQGFTLIELMIVVAIIAVLSLIAINVYGNIQQRGRDARRKSDIAAIANAMEVSKASSANYIALAATQFSSNTIPADPGSNLYCANPAANVVPGAFTNTCPAGWSQVGPGQPAAGAAWTVCAATESPVGVYCRSNSQ